MVDGGKGKVRLSEGHSVSKSRGRKSISIASCLVFYCCIARYYKLSGLQQSLCISSQFWKLESCLVYCKAEVKRSPG